MGFVMLTIISLTQHAGFVPTAIYQGPYVCGQTVLPASKAVQARWASVAHAWEEQEKQGLQSF